MSRFLNAMNYNFPGRSGLRLSVLSFGAMTFGRKQWGIGNSGVRDASEITGMDIVAVCYVAFLLYWILEWRKTKRTARRESVTSRLGYSLVTVLSCLLLFSRFFDAGILARRWLPATSLVEAAGIVLVVVGLGFSVWARNRLGRNWSAAVTVKEAHQLIRTGPYRYVRHPIYSGMIVAMAGAAMVNGQVRGVLSVPLLALGFYMKSRIEEGFMQNTFGAEYEAYRKSTGALVPRIW